MIPLMFKLYCHSVETMYSSSVLPTTEYEDTHHSFMECSKYADLRLQLFNAMSPYTNPDIQIIQHVYDNQQ